MSEQTVTDLKEQVSLLEEAETKLMSVIYSKPRQSLDNSGVQ
jgi:hypothetical protein